MAADAPRSEYPRPQWRRDAWQSLNGVWDFAFDDERVGLDEQWPRRAEWPQQIMVPFTFEWEPSGIGDPRVHPCVWYHRTFTPPETPPGGALWLHFGAVDYETTVWVNGTEIGAHRGGYTPFRFDIAPFVRPGKNHLVVRVVDEPDPAQPRGKQTWEAEPGGIFYGRTTGIWQTVWLEPVGLAYVDALEATFTRAPNRLTLRPRLRMPQGKTGTLRLRLTRQGHTVADHTWQVAGDARELQLNLPADLALWSPEAPHLYDARFELDVPAAGSDAVTCELGFRTIEIDGDMLLLNGEPYVQRLVLDQGYFPGGGYTPASVQAMRADVECIKALGFNGLRKHQKIEDPWFLTWCDRLGLLVWEEMPSAFAWSPALKGEVLRQFAEAMARDGLHPCIVAWVPFNESWGVMQLRDEPEQLAAVAEVYEAVKRLDPSRPVVANSGFFLSVTDLCDPHDYAEDAEELARHTDCFGDPEPEPSFYVGEEAVPLFVAPHRYAGQPVVLSEFGGIGYMPSPGPAEADVFVYGDMARSEPEFLDRIRGLTAAALRIPHCWGYCYTQLYDIDLETNGLLAFDRAPKAPMEEIAQINALQRPAVSSQHV